MSFVRVWNVVVRYLIFEEFGNVVCDFMYLFLLNFLEWEVLYDCYFDVIFYEMK